MKLSRFLVRVERFIPVPAQQLFDIVADPRQHPHIDGSGTVKTASATGPEKLSLGSRFSIGMKLGANYGMVNTVIEYEEGRRIAWKPKGDYLWRYTFTAVTGGTVVTEEWDARTSKRRFFMGLMGFPSRNRRGIEQTLEKLHNISVDFEDGAESQISPSRER